MSAEEANRLLGLRPNLEPHNENLTCGQWSTEEESMTAFDRAVARTGHFRIFEQVRGYYLQPRVGQNLASPRIDRILVPTQELLDQGWELGPIGIECKRSAVKIGPAIAQLEDYSRAAWEIRKGFWIVLQWLFLWPAHRLHNAIGSVTAQNRLGSAVPGDNQTLITFFSSAPHSSATFRANGTTNLGAFTNGRKTGSR